MEDVLASGSFQIFYLKKKKKKAEKARKRAEASKWADTNKEVVLDFFFSISSQCTYYFPR